MTGQPGNIRLRSSIKNKILSRYFNKLIDHGTFLEKRSTYKLKLWHEYNFLNSIPTSISAFYPPVRDFKENENYSHYFIQKIPVQDASYLLLSDSSKDAEVLKLLTKIHAYLELVPKIKVQKDEFKQAVTREISHKNLERLELIKKLKLAPEFNEICAGFGYTGLDDYISKLNLQIETELFKEEHSWLYFSHGDLCFSNLLLENDQLYLIDPKGAGWPEHNFRPIHYELAKMSQSLLGHYDLINHEMFQITNHQLTFDKSPSFMTSENYFNKLIEQMGTSIKSIRLVEASLFVSLLPFHQTSDQKVTAFLLNSLMISSRFM